MKVNEHCSVKEYMYAYLLTTVNKGIIYMNQMPLLLGVF